MLTDQQCSELKALVGTHWLDDSDPQAQDPYLVPERKIKGIAERGKASLVLLPESSEEVAAILSHCDAHRIPVFPQGGNTGLVGGSIPDESGKGIVLSLRRMNHIGTITPESTSVTVGAGVIVDTLKEEAQKHGKLFPLSHGGTGSATIGGSVATNAGGANALRYGVMRHMVLGATFVTPDGIIHHFGGTHKNTAGPDLLQHIIGGEGQLGIVTEVELRLYPQPQSSETLLLALPDETAADKLLSKLQAEFGNDINAFECMNNAVMQLVLKDTGMAMPLDTAQNSALYILAEVTSQQPNDNQLAIRLQDVLATALDDELVTDGAVAQNLSDRKTFWQLREMATSASKHTAAHGLYFDTAVPVHQVATFLREAESRLRHTLPQAFAENTPSLLVLAFGHWADGNIHLHIIQPESSLNTSTFNLLDYKNTIETSILDLAIKELGGTGWAEHGIGAKNLQLMQHYLPESDIRIMQKLKTLYDPNNIMNPGRSIPAI